MRAWLGEQATLKLVAFVALLPLAGVNLYLIVAGVAVAVEPGAFLGGLGWILALGGVIGLIIQATLMATARDAPLGSGIALAVIGGLMLLLGHGMMSEAIGSAMLLSPFPGSVLLMIAGWRAGRGERASELHLGHS